MKVKMLLLACSALCKFHVIQDQNARDQILSDRRSKCPLCIPLILLWNSKQILATYMLRMSNSNLEIRSVSSDGRSQSRNMSTCPCKLIKNYMGCQTGLDLLGREFWQEMMSECLQVTLQGWAVKAWDLQSGEAEFKFRPPITGWICYLAGWLSPKFNFLATPL